MWDGWPPFFLPSPNNVPRQSTIIQLHKLLIQLSLASRERNVGSADALSEPHWSGKPRHPRHNMQWERGTITAATATTITDNTKTWYTGGPPINNPWAGVQVHNPDPPASWDLIIDDCDFKRVIRVPITSWTATTLTVPDLSHFVTERTIPSLASLVGKVFFIIKRDGYWWSHRIAEWPNDIVYEGAAIAAGTATTITSARGGWAVNQWAGKDVMYQNTLAVLQRGNITSNTANVLTFNGGAGTPSGDFYIIPDEGYFQWERLPGTPGVSTTPCPIFAWCRDKTKDYWAHYPADADPTVEGQNVSSTEKVVLQGQFIAFDGGSCNPLAYDSLDNDYFSSQNEICSEPDDPKNPNHWKALFRSTQVHLEQLAERGSYIDPTKNYSGVTVRPSSFRFASMAAKAGINAQRSTTGAPITSGPLTGSISLPLVIPAYMRLLSTETLNVYYTMFGSDGTVLASGNADWQDGVLVGSAFANTTPTDPPQYIYANQRTVVSLGWSRWMLREFLRFYDKTVLIRDVDEDGNIVDPPDAVHPGRYVTRNKSAYYAEHSALGFVGDSNFNRDKIDFDGSGGDEVVARYSADNWNDPIHSVAQLFDVATANINIVKEYNRFFCGRHARPVQSQIDGSRNGTATSGTASSLTDTSKDWWTNQWYRGGIFRTESGVANGASGTTSLQDTAKIGNAFWDAATGRYLNFVIEVELSAGVWTKRPITGFNAATATLSWAEALPASCNGKNYRIREPKFELNRWRERSVTITWLDQSTRTADITHSDDQTIFFPALDQAVVAGCTYRLDEAQPGTVWKRKNGKWIKPTGVDPRSKHFGAGLDQEFLDDQRMNIPTMVKRYGRFMKGDVVCLPLLLELYDAFNWLQATIGDFGWTARHDPAVPESNHRGNFNVGGATIANAENDFITDWVDPLDPPFSNPIEGGYNDGGSFIDRGFVPTAAHRRFASDDPVAWENAGDSQIVRAYYYGTCTIGDGDNCPVTSNTDYYVKAEAPSFSIDPNPDILSNRCSGQSTTDTRWQVQFDSNGDPVQCGKFILFTSVNTDYPAGEGLVDRRSAKLGSNTGLPNRPGPPGFTDGSNIIVTAGWMAKDWFQITRWNFNYAIPVDQLIEGGTPRSDNPAWFNWWLQ